MHRRTLITILFTFAITSSLFTPPPACALITGGKDEPLEVRGLPDGALELANQDTRIAWWEGPPFGGGQYHFEYQGATKDLQKAIDLFAKVNSDNKRVVVQSGKKSSFWLGVADKSKSNPVDWQFVVWIPENWIRLNQIRSGLLPPGEEGSSPRTELSVYVTDRVDWNTIKIPEGLDVIDQRLAAHGLAEDQGAALIGRVTDSKGKAISGATISVGKDAVKRDGKSEDEGKYVITEIPEGTHRVTVTAPGYAPKDAYYRTFSEANVQLLEVQLAASTRVRVQVVDDKDDPLANVVIALRNCIDRDGNHYRLAGKQEFKTDAKGEFLVEDVPSGKLKFGSRVPDYFYNSVLNEHDTDESPIILKLLPTGRVKVTVVTEDGVSVTSKYMVEINEEGVDPIKGGGTGSWGGSANIGKDGSFTFSNIPPGAYVVTGRPNPGNERDRTAGVKVTIKGHDRHEVNLTAK